MRRLPKACRTRCLLAVACILSGVMLGGPAHAFETRVDADSTLQLYTVRSPWGTPVIMRERLTHTLGLDLDSYEGDDPRAVRLVGHFRLRLDGDYGIRPEERDTRDSQNLVVGLEVAPIDLSYGTLELQNLFHRTTSVRLGRQVVFDEMGWWSYDGIRVGFSPADIFEVAAFMGYEQRGGLPFLSTSRYESDGVFRGNRQGLDPAQYPAFLDVREPARAFGGSFAVFAIPHTRLRADYRRVTEHDQVVTVPFADQQGNLSTISRRRISSEKMGLGGGFDLGRSASLDAGLVYDAYRGRITDHQSQASVTVPRTLSVSLGHRYTLPSFDGDSIFNWFGAEGSVLTQAEVRVPLSSRLDLDASSGLRFFGVGGGDDATAELVEGKDWLIGAGGVLRQAKRTSRGRVNVEDGVMGRLVTAEVSSQQRFLSEHLEAGLLTGVSHFRDWLQPERTGTHVLYVTSLGWDTKPLPRFGLSWEHIIAETRAQRFRVTATMEARW